jgi:succinoglycan biosynthesis transport protein ExoP
VNEGFAFQDVRQHVAVLHKRRALILACVAASFAVSFIYNYTTRPLYQANCQILIEHDIPNVLPTKELMEYGQNGADYYATQYQLLRGRNLAEAAVQKLNLQHTPELMTGPLMSPWERVQRRFFAKGPAQESSDGAIPLSPAVAAFQSRLTVEPIQGSRLVNLRFLAYEPALAAQAVNTLAQLYIEQSLEFRFTTSSEATGWLSERQDEVRKKVEAAQRALQDYSEREGLVNFEEKQNLADQKLQTFAGAAMNARTDRITKETVFNQMRSLSQSQLESFPPIAASQVVQELRAHLGELRRSQAQLSETLGERHPSLLKINEEIKSTEDKLRSEIQFLTRAVESDYRAASQQEASLEANLDAAKKEALEFNRRAIELGVLKRELESNQQLFKDLTNRTKQTGLETELKSTNIRIVEKAETPRFAISPHRKENYLFGLLIGLGLGLALCVLFEQIDNTLKTPEDVKKHLSVPFLGMVPDVSLHGTKSRRGSPSFTNTGSSAAEAYRVLRTNLIFSSAETKGRALLVSSTNPSEGKTTTVTNLGAALAQNGARVLLIDADLRRPTVHQHFGLAKTPGLSDVIVKKAKVADAIQNTRYTGLQVLPCGYIPPNPAELLGSASMKELVTALRGLYDWVLIDTPPILAIADTSVLCPVVDGVILVIAAEASSRPAIHRAIDQIFAVGGKVAGVVLNKVDLERNAYYYGQYYGEYYRSYYSETKDQALKAVPSRPGPRAIRRP